MTLPVYLDYMATTPIDPRVVAAMQECFTTEGHFGNPASRHRYGSNAEQLVYKAREQVAQLINADPREIVWTSGATESDNLALKGAAEFYQRNGKHIITVSTEHKAVLHTCEYLARNGFDVTFLDPEPNGILDLKKLEAAMRPDTILVSVMHVNNETGVIQDMKAIGQLVKSHGAIFHVDAAQSVGKISVDVQEMKIDLLSISGHKMYAPKGVGVLYVRREPRVRLEIQMHGGGHERGMRSGTLATHQIVGLGLAAEIAQKDMQKNQQHLQALADRFWTGLNTVSHIHLNGDFEQRSPGCFNVCFEGVDNESLMLSLTDVALSAGSACNAASPESSHVLKSMGIQPQQAHQSVRMSMGRFTTEEDIDRAVAQITEQVQRLRELSPVWKKATDG